MMICFDAGSSGPLPLRYHFQFRAAMVLAMPFLFNNSVGDDLDAIGGALDAKLHHGDPAANAQTERHHEHVVGRYVPTPSETLITRLVRLH